MDLPSIAGVLVMSCLKFFFAGLVSFGMGHGFVETLVLTAIGGGLGMAAFYLAGARVLEWFRLRHIRRRDARIASGREPRRTFTRTNRAIVRVKRSYGLPGLALLPPILSVPITAVVAAKYFRHQRRTLPLLLSSVLAWSFVLTLLWSFVR